MFTFQFSSEKIDQKNNFAKLQRFQMAFYAITVNFIIQKLKSKYVPPVDLYLIFEKSSF